MKMTAHEIKHLNKISSFIHTISDRMIEDIKTILNGDYGLYDSYSKKYIEYYDFKFLFGYKIIFLPMGPNNFQLGYKEILTEYPNGFMQDMNLNLDESVYYYNDTDLAVIHEFSTQAEKRITEWFNQCWIKAGGLDVSDHYRISLFYLHTFFDLTHQKWMDEKK